MCWPRNWAAPGTDQRRRRPSTHGSGRIKPWVGRKQDVALRIKGFFAPKNRLMLLARDAFLNLTRVPGLAKPLLGSMFGDEPDLVQPA